MLHPDAAAQLITENAVSNKRNGHSILNVLEQHQRTKEKLLGQSKVWPFGFNQGNYCIRIRTFRIISYVGD